MTESEEAKEDEEFKKFMKDIDYISDSARDSVLNTIYDCMGNLPSGIYDGEHLIKLNYLSLLDVGSKCLMTSFKSIDRFNSKDADVCKTRLKDHFKRTWRLNMGEEF